MGRKRNRRGRGSGGGGGGGVSGDGDDLGSGVNSVSPSRLVSTAPFRRLHGEMGLSRSCLCLFDVRAAGAACASGATTSRKPCDPAR